MKNNKITENQLLDFFLLQELEEGCPPGYGKRVMDKLAGHFFFVPQDKIHRRKAEIQKGQAIIQPCSGFLDKPTPREGKDDNYYGFWALVDVFIPNGNHRHYVGLAANQIDVIRSHIGQQGSIDVVEWNEENHTKLIKLRDLIQITKGETPAIRVIGDDVWDWLRCGAKVESYNIFDLDLMQHIPDDKEEIQRWSRAIFLSSRKGNNVINLTCMVGRNITDKQHLCRLETLKLSLESQGFIIVGHSRFSYRDLQSPMRAERIVLNKQPTKRKENENDQDFTIRL